MCNLVTREKVNALYQLNKNSVTAVFHPYIPKKERKKNVMLELPTDFLSPSIPAATLCRESAPVHPDGQACTATRRVRQVTMARAAARSAPVATEPTATASVAPASALLDSQ